MTALLLGLALAATPEDLAAELPDAREQLRLCALSGCEREAGARAAWVVGLGTYLESGVADGALSATVRELDEALFSELPEVLRDAATEPLGWSTRVGGTAGSADGGQPPSIGREPMAPAERLEAVQAAWAAKKPRVFVWTPRGGDLDYDDPRVERELKIRTARPNAALYPAGDLCQQAPLSDAVTWDPDASGTGGTVSFERRGIWDPAGFARDYRVRIGGIEHVTTSAIALLQIPPGDHQLWMVREDGVGAVMELGDYGPNGIRYLPDEADACIAEAIESGPETLQGHFALLAERLPEAELFLAEVQGKVRDARMWKWKDGTLSEVPTR